MRTLLFETPPTANPPSAIRSSVLSLNEKHLIGLQRVETHPCMMNDPTPTYDEAYRKKPDCRLASFLRIRRVYAAVQFVDKPRALFDFPANLECDGLPPLREPLNPRNVSRHEDSQD